MATALYAAILTIIFIGLGFATISQRLKNKVIIGDGQNTSMIRAIRAHGNFAENIPLALLLMFLYEFISSDIFVSGAPMIIHILGVLLIVGRVSHAYAMLNEKSPLIFRQFGMLSTYGVMLTLSGMLIYQYVTA